MSICTLPASTLQCKACGSSNAPAALFCKQCTAPLSVAALSEFDDRDRRRCLSALFEVLAEQLKTESTQTDQHDPQLWQAYLSAFWLRPETALILYAEAMAIQSIALKTPWLDLGCGDGIHAAIYSGWRFDSAFDAFQSLDLQASDIYHHWNPEQFSAPISHSGKSIAHGVDIKDTAVGRAAALGVFAQVQQADATKLPLADAAIGTIFSNMLRDLGEPLPAALDECRRVLKPDGTLLISTMTPAYARNLYFARAAAETDDSESATQLLRLDRGRSVFCRQQLSISDWKILLNKHGLKIAEVKPIVGPNIIRFWDVGLRPFSIELLKLRQTWSDSGQLGSIKQGVMNLLNAALEPLAQSRTAGEACMNLLVVQKS